MASSLTEQAQQKFLSADAIPDGKTALVIFITFTFGLWVDSYSHFWGQIVTGILFWGLFIIIYHRTPVGNRWLMMSCLIVSFLGEIFCSLIWGLYDYRLYNIPHYVPPGHVLLFLLGSAIAPHMSRFIVPAVPIIIGSYVLVGYFIGFDQFGLLLFIMFLSCLIAEKDRRLYATMFLLCLILEFYGTWLGNWTWKPIVPVWEISTANPPVASGAFYCVLDFLMLRLALSYKSIISSMQIILISLRQERKVQYISEGVEEVE